ncbi:alpha/beta hydrolase [Aquamicrobium terrae]|uniref:Pimeloyl-ACP methyl ester carboxylesterase n=1 Tax=Aquamicrobium terrae TaxID=1324945 RepID=A0ABV2N3A1_9HYPH
MSETEVEAQVANGPLKGAMLLPPQAAGRPAVVIIPGSGPTDRDGNSPMGIEAGYLKMLAEALAEKGIGSIRVDKRGMFSSKGAFADPNAVLFDDYAGDALAWLKVAREKTGADCAWLLGHSEGGLVALIAAQEAGPDLCGLVLVSTSRRPLGEVLREQLQGNPFNKPILPQALAAVDALERGEKVDMATLPQVLQPLFGDQVQDFLIDGFSRRPAELIGKLEVPVLIVQGDNDLQVWMADAEALSQGQPAAELKVIAGMNHVLKSVPLGDIAANLASYGDPKPPLAPGLADAVVDFVSRRD